LLGDTYPGLLYAWNRPGDFAFLVGETTIAEVDPEFLAQLHGWIQGKAEIPPDASDRRTLL
jgi:hypothetical protein